MNITISCLFIYIYYWKFKVKKSNLIYPDSHRQFEHCRSNEATLCSCIRPVHKLYQRELHPFPCIYKELPGPLWQSSYRDANRQPPFLSKKDLQNWVLILRILLLLFLMIRHRPKRRRLLLHLGESIHSVARGHQLAPEGQLTRRQLLMKETWEREKSHYIHLLQNIIKLKPRTGGGEANSCPP